tara:strand:+ start:286 stop:465 length:180 start_codon:yes stop_codon:yes gene_type:complete
MLSYIYSYLYSFIYDENDYNEYIKIKKNLKKQITLKKQFYVPSLRELSEQRNKLNPPTI